MRGSRENRLRVPRETCVGVGSAVGRRWQSDLWIFFRYILLFFFERTRARWSRRGNLQKQKKRINAEKATQHRPTRKRRSGSDVDRGRGRGGGSGRGATSRRPTNRLKRRTRTKLPKTLIPIAAHTHIDTQKARCLFLHRRAPFLSLSPFARQKEREKSIKAQNVCKKFFNENVW